MIVTSCKYQAVSLHALVPAHKIQSQVYLSAEFYCIAHTAYDNIMLADAATAPSCAVHKCSRCHKL